MVEPCREPDASPPLAPHFPVVHVSRAPLVHMQALFANQPVPPVVSKHAPPSYSNISAHSVGIENKQPRTFVPGLRPPPNVLPPFVNYGLPVAPSWPAPQLVHPRAKNVQLTRHASRLFDDCESSDDACDTPPPDGPNVLDDNTMEPEKSVEAVQSEIPSATMVASEPACQPGILDECERKRSRKIKTGNPYKSIPKSLFTVFLSLKAPVSSEFDYFP